jgi:hypothetical protein
VGSDSGDQPRNAGLVADKVARVGAHDAERVDSCVCETRMREVNARPN